MTIELREVVQDDIKTIKPWLTDKENTTWLDAFFQNDQLSDEQLALLLLKRDRRTYMVLYHGVSVGITGIANIDEVNQSGHLWAVLGRKDYRRKGIITVALMLTLKKAYFELNLHSVNAWVVNGYISKGVCEKLRFNRIGLQRECHRVDGGLRDRILFDILRNEFDESALYEFIDKIE